MDFLKSKWWLLLIILAVLGIIGYLGYSYIDTRNQLTQLSTQSKENNAAQVQSLVDEISQYLALPQEMPSMATVSDVSKLNGQEFFKNAQNGDKVLIFSQAGRALLYRPADKKVIEYAKVDLSSEPAQ